MSNVIHWGGVTRLDSPPASVLERASEAELESVVIVGFCADGSEYFCSSMADGGDVLWHLERAKLKLLTIADRGEAQ